MKHKGVTLIELMIVVAIIEILAAVAIPSVSELCGQSTGSREGLSLGSGGLKTALWLSITIPMVTFPAPHQPMRILNWGLS